MRDRGDEVVVQLIEKVYDTVDNEGAWQEVLSSVAGHMHAAGASLVGTLAPSTQARIFGQWGYDESLALAYNRHYWQYDIGGPRAASLPTGSILDDRTLLTPNELRNSPFYNELLAGLGLSHVAGVTVLNTREECVHLTFHRTRRSGRPNAQERLFLGRLAPHVCRALKIHRKVGGLLLQRDAAWHTLDHLDHAIAIADGSASVVFANAAARRLFEARRGLAVDRGRIVGRKATVSAAIAKLLSGAAPRSRESEPVGGDLTIDRSTSAPLELTVMPLSKEHGFLGGPMALAVVFIGDAARKVELPSVSLRRRYGLSPTEIRVVQSIAIGCSLRETANALSIQMSTARTHLKRVFNKTGVGRQVDLVRLLVNTVPPVSRR